jgi:hypothetical protein
MPEKPVTHCELWLLYSTGKVQGLRQRHEGPNIMLGSLGSWTGSVQKCLALLDLHKMFLLCLARHTSAL